MRRGFATILTLGILGSFLLVTVLGVMVYFDAVSLPVAVAVVVLINLGMLLVGPRVNDFIYRWLYDMEWVTVEEFRERSPASVAVVEEVGKSVHVFAGFERARFPRSGRTAAVAGEAGEEAHTSPSVRQHAVATGEHVRAAGIRTIYPDERSPGDGPKSSRYELESIAQEQRFSILAV